MNIRSNGELDELVDSAQRVVRGVAPQALRDDGALRQHGSIAVVERLVRTLKENIQLWPLVPQREEDFRGEILLFTEWYNSDRPHATLGGRTLDEVYFHRFPNNRKPRYEPRERWRKSFLAPDRGLWFAAVLGQECSSM